MVIGVVEVEIIATVIVIFFLLILFLIHVGGGVHIGILAVKFYDLVDSFLLNKVSLFVEI